jgi:hypothetical protein
LEKHDINVIWQKTAGVGSLFCAICAASWFIQSYWSLSFVFLNWVGKIRFCLY